MDGLIEDTLPGRQERHGVVEFSMTCYGTVLLLW